MGAYPDIVYPGRWIVEGGQTSTGSIINWLRRLCGGELDLAALNAKADLLEPGAEGLVVQDHFQGNRTPYTDSLSRGAITGLTLAPDLASAVAALARSLPRGLTLIGHSLGAVAAVMAAVQLGAHVGRLVLLTPAGAGPRIGAEFVHGMADARSAAELSHLLRLLGPRGGSLSDAALAEMAAQMARGRLKPLADAVATAGGRQRVDILRPLAQLTLPVSAVFGTADAIVDPRDALNLPLNVAAHFVPTGHMPQWDAARDLTDLILAGDDHG